MRLTASKWLIFRFCLAGTVVVILCAGSRSALGQGEKPGRLTVTVKVTDDVLKGRPVMVSAIGGGKVITQYEIQLAEAHSFAYTVLDSLPPGQYDVRVEGDGVVTEVKRGVQVFPGRDGSLIAVVRPGQGAHIVEYATGGLAREEVAARIAKLEAAVADLQKAHQAK